MAELGSYPADRKSGVVNLHLRLRAPVPYPTCSEASCCSSGWKSHRQKIPVAAVVIPSSREGDRPAESLGVKAS